MPGGRNSGAVYNLYKVLVGYSLEFTPSAVSVGMYGPTTNLSLILLSDITTHVIVIMQ